MSALQNRSNSMTSLSDIKRELLSRGWILLRNEGYTLESFSELMNQLCRQLTFDPAREYSSAETQKVDAGRDAVGLHIENGNTPLPPDFVAFHSVLSARFGAQTTVCDGAAIYKALPETLRHQLEQPWTVTRYLPKVLWQRYVANTFSVQDPDRVTRKMLDLLMELVPGQSAMDTDDGGIIYTLTVNPIRSDNLARVPAFANAILGPSYNYEAPQYCFLDGEPVSDGIIEDLRNLCERFTEEIQWCDGDVVVIDNKRIMHGRRVIPVPLSERKLVIGMGSVLAF